jgi:hypothetical protein
VWSSVFTESAGRPFSVDDESGETAKVIPNGANIILDENVRGSFGDWQVLTPEFEAFLKARGIESSRWFGLRNRMLRIVEEILAPGDQLRAVSAARREPVSPAHDGERTAQATRLVLSQTDAEEGELILTNQPEDELTRRLRKNFTGGLLFAAAGAVVVLAGFVAAFMRGVTSLW